METESKAEDIKAYCKKCEKSVAMVNPREGDDGDLITMVGKCPYCGGQISTLIGK